jgi:hypothetical protein
MGGERRAVSAINVILIGYLVIRVSSLAMAFFGGIVSLLLVIAGVGGRIAIVIGFVFLYRAFIDAGWRRSMLLLIASAVGGMAATVLAAAYPGPAGSILATLFSIAAVIGYVLMNRSPVLYNDGQLGSGLLVISSVLLVVAPLAALFPVVLGTILGGAGFVSLILVILGWGLVRKDFAGSSGT